MPQLEHPFLLAPMAGITHSPFRRLMRDLGSSSVISELVSANGIEFASVKTLNLLKFSESERPVGLQIFGEREELLVKACQVVEKQGADFVLCDMGLLNRGIGRAKVDEQRREADQGQDHGDETEVVGTEQARQYDRRRQLHENVDAARGDKDHAAA